jgi:hypothetical protein
MKKIITAIAASLLLLMGSQTCLAKDIQTVDGKKVSVKEIKQAYVHGMQFLIVLSAKSGELEQTTEGHFVLKTKLSDLVQSAVFTQRPYRIAHYATGKAIAEAFKRINQLSFVPIAPNAVLSSKDIAFSGVTLEKITQKNGILRFYLKSLQAADKRLYSRHLSDFTLTVDSLSSMGASAAKDGLIAGGAAAGATAAVVGTAVAVTSAVTGLTVASVLQSCWYFLIIIMACF